MSEYPLISVVLPVYNCALYIDEAINSILNQTIQDFEIIIIDDCSVDDTVKIIQTISDSRIKLILKEKNKGLIDSLNVGFKEAKGKYIARMDGDDISMPERFKKQLEVLENDAEIQVCGCWLQCFDTSSKIIKYKEFHEEIQAHLLLSNSMSLCSAMLNKEAFKNFLFDSTKVHVEDYDFWARTVFNYKFYNIQEPLYYYRVHEEQVSTKYKAIQIQGDIEIKLALYRKLKYNDMIYNDELISKILYTYRSFSILELKLILEWFNKLKRNNKKHNVFDNLAFKKVISKIKRKLIFDIFFTNHRKHMTYDLRKKIFKILPVDEKIFVVKNKIGERLKFLLKRF